MVGRSGKDEQAQVASFNLIILIIASIKGCPTRLILWSQTICNSISHWSSFFVITCAEYSVVNGCSTDLDGKRLEVMALS